MTKAERAVCAEMGIAEADYLRAKARRLGISVNAARGMGFGMDAVREMMNEMRESGEIPPDADPQALRAEAEEARAAYQDSGDWHDAARAICFDLAALDADAPGYAERHRDDPDGDDGASDDGGGGGAGIEDEAAEGRGLRSPFTTHRRPEVGSATVRLVQNGRARIERLSASEIAVCARLGLRFENYAAERARRRVTE